MSCSALVLGASYCFAFYLHRSTLPASANEPQLVGLNLLRLLVANRIAEFHTELELIPPEVGVVTES
jgi:hypothetical protein